VNSIFLRIYGGMLAALVLVALLGAAALHWVNQVRSDEYREHLAQGTFRLMADNLKPLNELQRRSSVRQLQSLLGIGLQVQGLAEQPLTANERTQLLAGRVLVRRSSPQAAKVYSLISAAPERVLVGDVQQVSEQLARATVYMLSDELQRYPQVEQPQRLAELKHSKQFGFPLRLLDAKQTALDEDQRRRVMEGDTVMTLGQNGDAVHIFAGVLDSTWVLEIGPLYLINPASPQLLVVIGLLGLSLIGLIVYLLVRQLERRLRGLESAATRIAAGSLSARATIGGADSVGRLATAFNNMAMQLQQLLTIQREMVRAVSHELRTPVARLRFGLEMLGDAQNDVARRKYQHGMDNDIQELDRLVDEMLTYARLEQGAPPLQFQWVDLDALLDQVLTEQALLRPEVYLQRGTPPGETPVMVEGELRFLHRALQNLLTNAMRHAESQVRVSYHLTATHCQLDVEDDGPGVPEVEWERLFTPFLRLDDSRTRASGGHGLGLSIVRRIIHWHAGRALIATSDSLGGARFSLLWPQRQSADPELAGDAHEA
jgi:two-component system sensor histidine kinase RstB